MSRVIKIIVTAIVFASVVFGGYSWLEGREPAGSGLITLSPRQIEIRDGRITSDLRS